MNRKNDNTKFASLMGALAEVFDNGKEPSAIKIEIYFKALKEYPIKDIEKAVNILITSRVFPSFPKPAEIIQDITGNDQDRAIEAWAKVDSTVKSHGPYVSVKFDDDVIHSCIELMGGWVNLCNEDIKNWHWKQKEFVQLYATLSKKNIHPEYLPGIVEKENDPRGLKFPSPVLIGDKKLELMKGG